jgi:hypothetical protein
MLKKENHEKSRINTINSTIFSGRRSRHTSRHVNPQGGLNYRLRGETMRTIDPYLLEAAKNYAKQFDEYIHEFHNLDFLDKERQHPDAFVNAVHGLSGLALKAFEMIENHERRLMVIEKLLFDTSKKP